ncbi:MFS transporter [Raoultibacter massiliensis]|uniref:MFS transporter n=1 Tax=Raoultibacter massiliensis TaxID=1852371 RepID=UPI0011AF59F0|nr:MFS transporter [Raoultibacter massiliensis]
MSEKKKGIHYAWLVMIGCCFLQAGALGAIMNSGGIFFVPICDDLGFDRGAIALYLTFYFIATTFTYPLVAKFLPKWNFRVFLTVCFLIIAATEACMGLFTELWQWYVAGVVLGVAGALVFVVASTVLIENWFVEKRGTALGIAMCGSGIGGVIFPMLGTWLIEVVGWRMAYPTIAVIICIIVLPWTMFVFRLNPSELGLKPYGAERAAELEAEASHAKGMPAKKAIVTLAFVCIFAYAGIEALFSGYNNHLPGFAESLGYTAAFGAGILSLAQLGYTVATLVMGWVTDKIGVAASTYITLGVTAASLLGFSFLQDEVPLMVAAFVFGMNSVIITISVPTLISDIFGKKYFAQILSYSRMSGIIGCFGAAAVGACYDITGSYVGSFVAGIVILVICAILVGVALTQKKKIRMQWE